MKYILPLLFYFLILFTHTAFGQYEGAVIKGIVTDSRFRRSGYRGFGTLP